MEKRLNNGNGRIRNNDRDWNDDQKRVTNRMTTKTNTRTTVTTKTLTRNTVTTKTRTRTTVTTKH